MITLRTQNLALYSALLCAAACGNPALPWPASPLISFESGEALDPMTREQALERIAGHYAHFDVVAYEEPLRGAPMRTFVVSYGFTDFRIVDGELVESDRFCHAEHRINRAGMRSSLSDRATRAIAPPPQKVSVVNKEGRWLIDRPASPSLIGIKGDQKKPLPNDRKDADFSDPDGDNKPGVTVQIRVNRYISGEVYLARREIFENRLELMADGSIRGTVTDRSEQLVAGASSCLFDSDADPKQASDPGLNPIVLIPIDESLTSCDELMKQASSLFPPVPEFKAP